MTTGQERFKKDIRFSFPMANDVSLKYHCGLCGAVDISNRGEEFASFHRDTPPRGPQFNVGDIVGYNTSFKPHERQFVFIEQLTGHDSQHYAIYSARLYTLAKWLPLMAQTGASHHRELRTQFEEETLYELATSQYQHIMQKIKAEPHLFDYLKSMAEISKSKIRRGRIRT